MKNTSTKTANWTTSDPVDLLDIQQGLQNRGMSKGQHVKKPLQPSMVQRKRRKKKEK